MAASFSLTALATDWQPTVERVTNEVIRSGYHELESALGEFQTQAEAFCQKPTEQTYQTTQQAWREAMLAWMGVSWIQFGPISSGTGRFDLQIWPIRKGITHEKIQTLLADADLSAETIRSAGVSVRGLTGAEYLLFSGSGGQLNHYQDETAKNRCLILTQAIQNARQTASGLRQAWDTEQVITPYQQGVDMLDASNKINSAASILWNALLSEIEFIQLRKLEGPINPYAKKAKPTQAESWRSQHSFNNLERGLVELKRVYTLGFQSVIQSQDSELNSRVVKRFDQLIGQVAQFKEPMVLMLKTEEGRNALKAFDKQVHDFYLFMRTEVSPKTGFVLGFNANDGD
jgi:predicted lipoprotein